MNQKNLWLILAAISIVSLALASVSTVMVILPNNNTPLNALSGECSPRATGLSKSAADLPGPLGAGSPANRTFHLLAREACAEIEPGVSYMYWTFNGTVPGPFLRVRLNDTVTIDLQNAANSTMAHSIDLHAVIGPGGGMMLSQTGPGQSRSFWFKALHPGLYVYHCATSPPDGHIANGMYGLILVEPTGGLPPVDREFYIMQGELYTSGDHGQPGHHRFSSTKMITGIPDYVVFNGQVGSLTGNGVLTATTTERIRIFFGVGGPNLDSSFHIIGQIFDTAYLLGTVDPAARIHDVQTVSVPPGGSTVVEFKPTFPTSQTWGSYAIVDHSLSWAIGKGAVGTLTVTGTAPTGIFGP